MARQEVTVCHKEVRALRRQPPGKESRRKCSCDALPPFTPIGGELPGRDKILLLRLYPVLCFHSFLMSVSKCKVNLTDCYCHLTRDILWKWLHRSNWQINRFRCKVILISIREMLVPLLLYQKRNWKWNITILQCDYSNLVAVCTAA